MRYTNKPLKPSTAILPMSYIYGAPPFIEGV